MPRKKPAAPAPRKKARKRPAKPQPTVKNNEHVPNDQTRHTVRMAAGIGLPHSHIIHLIGIGSTNTLVKHYQRELDLGKAEAVFKAAGTLFSQATNKLKPNLGALVFYLKCQAGWREKHVLDDPMAKVSLAQLIALSGIGGPASKPADYVEPEQVVH